MIHHHSPQKERGFTLVELVIVIIVLGVLSALVLPKFIDLQSDAVNSTKLGVASAVKSALAVAIAEKATGSSPFSYPSVTELNNSLMTANTTATATGIQATIDDTVYTVPTYTDTKCTTPTTAVSSQVGCVGEIP